MKPVLLVIVAALLTLGSLTGCNTISGVGKDVQKGGEALENAADRT